MDDLLIKWIYCFSVLFGFQMILNLIKLFEKKKQIRDKQDLHLVRRFQHVMSGVIIVYLSKYLDNIILIQFFMFLALLIMVSAEVSRRYYENINKWMANSFSTFLRKEELLDKKPITSMFFILGTFLSFILFKYEIACLAILTLSFGDPFASIIGIKFGRFKLYGEKSLVGNLACGLLCGVVNAIYLTYFATNIELQNFTNINKFVIGLITGSLSELLPSTIFYDDNASIPVYAGIMLTFINNYLIKS